MQELERIALVVDLPEHGLKIGDLGMILHVYGEHTGYEVEFVTVNGDLVALVSVFPNQIRQVESNEIASVRQMKSA